MASASTGATLKPRRRVGSRLTCFQASILRVRRQCGGAGRALAFDLDDVALGEAEAAKRILW